MKEKTYLEHVHITVCDLGSVIHFLTTAFEDFKVRKRFYVKGSNSEWIHIGTDSSYITFVQSIHPNKRALVFKKEFDIHLSIIDNLWYSFIFYKAKKKNLSRRPNQLKSGLNHLGFVVDSIDKVVGRLKSKNFKGGINNGKIIDQKTFRQAYFLLPNEQIEIEFVEYKTENISSRNEYYNVFPVKE